MPVRKAAKKPPQKQTNEKRAFSQNDLVEFRLRHQALTVVSHQQALVNEAYEQWLAKKGREYGVKGRFQVDVQTGEITCQT